MRTVDTFAKFNKRKKNEENDFVSNADQLYEENETKDEKINEYRMCMCHINILIIIMFFAKDSGP